MRISDWSSDVCSSDLDLTVQRDTLLQLGVAADRIYTDKGFTGTNRTRPGLDQALAAVRRGDTLVVPKLDRLARSVPDARAIGDDLAARGVKLQLGASVHDPADPRSEEHTSELQSLMRISYSVFCLKNKKTTMTYTS